MLQYLKFQENIAEGKSYSTPSGIKVFLFFAARIGFALFMIYATFFLAVATPFIPPNHPLVYIGGFSIVIVLFVRIAGYIYSFSKLGTVVLTIDKNAVSFTNKNDTFRVNSTEIEYLEFNLLGNLVLHTKEKSYIFPAGMIDRKIRKELLSLFSDMAPARTNLIRKTFELGDAIVMASILAMHIIQFGVQNFYIPSGSMISTLLIGDRLFAEKLTFGPRVPQMAFMKSDIHIKIPFVSRDIRRGDIIIFNPPVGEVDKDFIKRCIAVEGDEYHIRDGAVWINGKKLDEPYTRGVTDYANFPSPAPIEGVVPTGMVIAMGDNRENSSDSRYFGYVPVGRIKAKALFLYYNPDQFWKFDFSRFGLIR